MQGMPDQAKHISSSFDAALGSLRNVWMMSSIARMFQTAFGALLSRNCPLCDQVMEDEEAEH
jgi:hypothetical protein